MISSPLATASAPPGQKSTCMSTTINARMTLLLRTGNPRKPAGQGQRQGGPCRPTPPDGLPLPPRPDYAGRMFTVAALYHFAPLADPGAVRAPLLALCRAQGVRGTLSLAREGVNGTIAGPREGIEAVLAHIRGWPGFAALEWKESTAATLPFGRMKIRVKPEIVTMGQPGIDPTARVGRHVAPADWNAVISD